MSAKTLYLLRHAKSSWGDEQLDDHDRPLNSRGRKAAARVGRLLKDESLLIDRVLCSTSVRTRQTADLVFAASSKPPPISYREDLYHPTPDQIISILNEVPEQVCSVMVISHNPGLEEFLTVLTNDAVPFPTAALAMLELDVEYWSDLGDQTHGKLVQMWRPKELDDR